jgi:hypothetical protein
MATIVKKTTDELQVDCEVAAEVYAEYLAFCAKQLAEEWAAESPNQEKIDTLEAKVRKLKKEKLSIGINNTVVINKALYLYAPLLNKRLCGVNG